MQNVKTVKELRRYQPDRYQQVPKILESMATQTAREISATCGTKNPKIREVTVKVDFKKEVPVATVLTRYFRKWGKVAEFQIKPNDGLNFVPFVAVR